MSPTKKVAKKKVEVQNFTPDTLRKAMNDHFGPDTIRKASDPSLRITRIPTGILSMDYVTSGGFPRGRYVELYGSANVGKTACALRTLASAQSLGLHGAFVDVEGTFDPEFAEHLGVNLETLDFEEQDEHGNKVIDTIETMLRARLHDVIVMDSIAALLPKAEQEASMGASSMGMEQAKLMSKALRKLTAAQKNTLIIFINQTRDSMSMFAKSVTSGGRAMGFYAGTRIEMVRTENIRRSVKLIDPKSGDEKKSETTVGHRVLVRVEKDKTGGSKPYEQTSFIFDYEASNIDHLSPSWL